MRYSKRVCLCLPTGGGKTIIFSHIANEATKRSKKVLVCVHRNELKEQAERTTNATVVMVETLNNKIKAGEINVNDYDLIIIDEAHIGNFRKVLDNYNGYVIGATATPVTTNKDYPLHLLLQEIVIPISINELINLGRLAKPRTFARVPEKLNELKKIGGEYTEKSLNNVFDNRQVFNGILEDYKNNCIGKKGIVFCCSIPHTISVYNQFLEIGANVFMVHSKMKERAEPVEKYKNSKDGIIINCGILTTGFDCPDIDFVMINRATTSDALWLQMIGRGSRTTKTKHFFNIYDYGMNVKNLGFWQQEREWNNIFFNIKDKKNIGVPPVKTCKSCNAVVNTSAKICEYCGAEFEEQIKKEYETKLIELTYERLNGKYINSLTIEELILVAERKKWKQQFVERIIYHNLGIDKLNDFWNNKNYKHGYRIRRLDLFKSETPTKNFKVNL